jgi:hypothetical protein
MLQKEEERETDDVNGAEEQESERGGEGQEREFRAVLDELKAEESEPDEGEEEEDRERMVDGGKPYDRLASLLQNGPRVQDLKKLHQPI